MRGGTLTKVILQNGSHLIENMKKGYVVLSSLYEPFHCLIERSQGYSFPQKETALEVYSISGEFKGRVRGTIYFKDVRLTTAFRCYVFDTKVEALKYLIAKHAEEVLS